MALPATITITLRCGEPLRRVLGAHRLQVELVQPATLTTLLHQLETSYAGFATAFAGEGLGHHQPYQIYVNHNRVAVEAFDLTLLNQDDIVHIVIPVGGGW